MRQVQKKRLEVFGEHMRTPAQNIVSWIRLKTEAHRDSGGKGRCQRSSPLAKSERDASMAYLFAIRNSV